MNTPPQNQALAMRTIVRIIGALISEGSMPPFSEIVFSNSMLQGVLYTIARALPLIIGIVTAGAGIIAYIAYRSFYYKIEYNYFSFVKGYINRKKVSIPFRQIQNVDIEQCLMYRICGVVSVVIMTAGHMDPQHRLKETSEIILPPFSVREGRLLQEFLLSQSNIQIVVNEELPDPRAVIETIERRPL